MDPLELEHWKGGIETARAHHRFQLERIAEAEKSVISFGLAAVRAPILINSGGLAALLTFASAKADALTSSLADLRHAFFLFVIGLLCSALSPAAAYFTESARAVIEAHVELSLEYPYVTELPDQWRRKLWRFFFGITVALVVAGYLLFFIGARAFFELVREVVL